MKTNKCRMEKNIFVRLNCTIYQTKTWEGQIYVPKEKRKQICTKKKIGEIGFPLNDGKKQREI